MEKVFVLSTKDGVLCVSKSIGTCGLALSKLYDELNVDQTNSIELSNGEIILATDSKNVLHMFRLTEEDLKD